MFSIEILGYCLAVIIGVSIGLLGGGGAILAVPMMVYFFGIEPEKATGYSLVIVALSSVISFWQKKDVGKFYPKVLLEFGIPSVAMIYLTKSILVPMIPNLIIFSPKVIMTKNMLLMTIFAVVLLASSLLMLKNKNVKTKQVNEYSINFNKVFYGLIILYYAYLFIYGGTHFNIPEFGFRLIVSLAFTLILLILKRFYEILSSNNEEGVIINQSISNLVAFGAFIGFLTGLIGVGGAFLIVPAFISLVGMDTKEAIKNSLVIVIFNSIFGFYGFAKVTSVIDIKLILIISIIATFGVFLGSYLNKKFSNEKIRNIFGWMNLILSFVLLMKEVILRIYPIEDFIKTYLRIHK